MAALASTSLSAAQTQRSARVSRRAAQPARATVCVRASADKSWWSEAATKAGSGLAALSLAATLQAGAVQPALANGEFDILNSDPPNSSTFLVDDARVINQSTRGELISLLTDVQAKTGFHVNVVTIRKLAFASDAFEFADRVIEKWYPTAEQGNKQGLFVLVTAGKEGALVGGPNFIKAVGNGLVDSLVSENVPILAGEEKFNETVLSSARRIEAALEGKADPGPPVRSESKKGSNFKSKEETDAKRNQFSGVVLGLLVIAFVVPMIQYFGYTQK